MKILKSKLAKTILIVMIIWLALSYAEILSKNVRPNPEYSNMNIIVNYINWLNNINVAIHK